MTTTAPRLARLVKQARTALAARRQRARRLLARLERLNDAPARRFHELGQLLLALKTDALYRALGHTSFAALLRRHGLGTPARAAKLIRIAQELPAARARALGLDAAYAAATARTTRRAHRAASAAAAAPARTRGDNAARAALAR